MFLLLVLALPAGLFAQVGTLAVNGNGSELLFQSGYSLSSEIAPPIGTSVYKYRAGEPEVLARVNDQPNRLSISSVFISDDGRTRGWTTIPTCSNPICSGTEQNRTVLTLERNGGTGSLFGNLGYSVSRNGRWVITSGFGTAPPLFFPMIYGSRYDLDTGKSVELPGFSGVPHPTHSIADDGTVLANSRSGLGVYAADGSGVAIIPVPGKRVSAAITRDGRKIFALTETTLYEINRATLATTELYTSAADGIREFSPSALGDRVLISTEKDVFLAEAGEVTRVYSSPEDVVQILLTGDGRTSFVRTRHNRVVRIGADGVTELLAPLPSQPAKFSDVMAPGSLLQMLDGPFVEGQTLTVDDVEFPVVAIEEGKFEAQIPWEFGYQNGQNYTLRTPGHPFAVRGRFPGSPFSEAPGMYRNDKLADGYTVKAALADFGSLMSVDNPAPAGSTIHFWLTGLGPLDRPLATVERGPSNPPAKPITPFACYIIRSDNVPAARGLELPFAAYGPGLLGVYQVDAVIPADWPSGPSTVHCYVGTRFSNHGHGRIYVK